MRSLAICVFASAFALVASAGCNRLRPKKPTVVVQGVSVGAVSFSGISGTLSVEVTNPNNFGVPLAAVDWQLSVGNARAVSGRIELSNTIPAKGATNVQIALRVNARDAIAVARKLAGGERSYRVQGVLHFNAPIGRIDVEFSGEGSIGRKLSLRSADVSDAVDRGRVALGLVRLSPQAD